ncbi:hypothetical protein GCM10009682_11680 [Luedemannella flava]|uniref:Uncharacterized protein n=1 Tax=Luedemannella flava TaxID=349316 RepID=A0ABP4XT59_9ACTN
MADEPQHSEDAPRESTSKWRALPDRVHPSDMVESAPEDPPPSTPPAAGDPDTNWLLRWGSGG